MALICIWLTLVMSTLEFTASQPERVVVPALFFFGASMLDVGSNNFLNYTSEANFLPYGETFFLRPTGRHSNGLILSDLIELKLEFPFLPTYLDPNGNFTLGANFASAGSGILDTTSTAGGPMNKFPVIPLHTQVDEFKQLLLQQPHLVLKLHDALIVVNAGKNDLMVEVIDNNLSDTSSIAEMVELLIDKLKQSIEEIYRLGARKFLIIGINPTGDQPEWRSFPLSTMINLADQLFNEELERMVRHPGDRFKSARFTFFQMYDILIDMMINGTKYGFTETMKDCYDPPFLCDDPSAYLYWDGHPTQRGYEWIVDAIWSGSPPLVWPQNLQTFLQDGQLIREQ